MEISKTKQNCRPDITEHFSTQEITDDSKPFCSEKTCSKVATRFSTQKIGMFTAYLPWCEKHANQIKHSIYYMPEAGEVVEAEVHLEVERGQYFWIIDSCPYCTLSHSHGGGKVGEDDPYDYMGHRVAHCGDPFRGEEITRTGYILIESPEEPSPRELARELIDRIAKSDDCCNQVIAGFVAEQIENAISNRQLTAVMRLYQDMKANK